MNQEQQDLYDELLANAKELAEAAETLRKAAGKLGAKAVPTVEEVYGRPRSQLKAPEGFRLGEFRQIRAGDKLMFLSGGKGTYNGSYHKTIHLIPYENDGWRIVLEPLPPKPQPVIKLYRLVTYEGPESDVRALVESAPDLERERAGEVRISRREIKLPAELYERVNKLNESWEALEAN